ncbi:flippase-like domain-containing protein [Candidatus Poribacteria bacterium]|nr:flippase-like domain-containing protein [Candidatus Poribacteria bacterium]
MKKHAGRLIALAVSVCLLGLLFAGIDRGELREVLAGASPWWIGAGLLLFVPQIAAIAWRWALIASPVAPIGWGEAARQVLASSCLNLVLPSKLGDLAKGVFLYRQGRCQLGEGLQVVVFEKLLDMAALSAWMLAGWIVAFSAEAWVLGTMAFGAALIAGVWVVYFVPRGTSLLRQWIPAGIQGHAKFRRFGAILDAGPRVMTLIHAEGGRRRRILAWSAAIWFLHLAQIVCFFFGAGVEASAARIFGQMPLALFAGLVPVSIAGVGVRDWAMVTIFASGANSREAVIGAALLVSLRYVVPALAGLPFMSRYLQLSREARPAGGGLG